MAKKQWQQLVLWGVLSTLGVLLFSVSVVHIPSFARKLFLVALIFSVASALLIRWLLDQFKIIPTHFLFGICVLIIFFGHVVSGIESHRIWKQVEIEKQNASPLGKFFSTDLEPKNIPEKDRAFYNGLKKLMEPKLDFKHYLKFRYSRLGTMKSPAPEITWGLEIIGTTLFGAFLVFSRYRKFDPAKTESEIDPSDESIEGEEA